jgi:hypothetical protein
MIEQKYIYNTHYENFGELEWYQFFGFKYKVFNKDEFEKYRYIIFAITEKAYKDEAHTYEFVVLYQHKTLITEYVKVYETKQKTSSIYIVIDTKNFDLSKLKNKKLTNLVFVCYKTKKASDIFLAQDETERDAIIKSIAQLQDANKPDGPNEPAIPKPEKPVKEGVIDKVNKTFFAMNTLAKTIFLLAVIFLIFYALHKTKFLEYIAEELKKDKEKREELVEIKSNE